MDTFCLHSFHQSVYGAKRSAWIKMKKGISMISRKKRRRHQQEVMKRGETFTSFISGYWTSYREIFSLMVSCIADFIREYATCLRTVDLCQGRRNDNDSAAFSLFMLDSGCPLRDVHKRKTYFSYIHIEYDRFL